VVILVVSNVAKRQPHENNLNSSMKQGGSARRDTVETNAENTKCLKEAAGRRHDPKRRLAEQVHGSTGAAAIRSRTYGNQYASGECKSIPKGAIKSGGYVARICSMRRFESKQHWRKARSS
ncbi:hypothetical protein, partial [Sinorhizobium meliloti]|uniref:hypothetical protein n=1 Tax=Rhizobium meliloti TaxID=382 RepID=UPI001AECD35A